MLSVPFSNEGTAGQTPFRGTGPADSSLPAVSAMPLALFPGASLAPAEEALQLMGNEGTINSILSQTETETRL